jgi:uncharacterized lipoprotein YbaY/heat shock protein HslJ
LSGCVSLEARLPSDHQLTSLDLRNRIQGTWVRPIDNQPGNTEGLRFDDDGRFGLIGIHTMHGLQWQIEDDALVVTTNTQRYPEPFETRLRIKIITDTTLVLEGDNGYLLGAWRRDDTVSGRITGQVTYRERIALPPDAVIHLTLEDVSRQDGPGTYIAGQVIPAQGRQVPIPFALYYATRAIDPGHTYQVRAAIVIDGRRRFLTTRAYPVLTRGHGDQIQITVQGISSTPALSTRKLATTTRVENLDLPATYSGQLNGRAGKSAQITLNLYADRMFLLRKSLGMPSGYDLGRWYLAHGGRQLVLIGRAEAPYKLAVKSDDTFRLMGLNGGEDLLQQPVDLTRRDNLDPFADTLPLTGMFQYMADAARFTECRTDLSFAVAQENDYLALERAYLEKRQTPGEPLFITLTGHMGQRPPMEGDGMETILVVDRFETIQPGAACPPRPALAMLENTYWKLTELYGHTITFVGNGQGEPHLILRPPERQLSGFSGCNGFFGLYRADSRRLFFEKTGATMRACPNNPDLEQTFFKALKATEQFKIFGEMLEFYRGREVVARFEAVYF